MATDKSFAEFVVDQIQNAGVISLRKMFGEYAIYSDGKVFGLLCDNQLFIKPTEGGRKFVGEITEAPAYPGAKPTFLIDDRIEDRDWLSELVRISVKELPFQKSKPKKEKSKKK